MTKTKLFLAILSVGLLALGGGALLVVRGAVGEGHPHGAEAERGDAQALGSQIALVHEFSPDMRASPRPTTKPNRSV